MSKILIQENGRVRDYSDVEWAEEVIKKRNNKDQWSVIDDLVNTWAKRSPEDVEAMRVNVTEYREALIDKRFGQTKDGADQERRFTLAFPKGLMMLIRTQYKSEELQFDKKFFREFAKRYPAFKVAEEV